MDISDRIKLIIEKERLNIPAFAKRLNVGDQTIRGIVIQKRNKPGYDLLLKIIQTFEWINVEWLITGEGEMSKSIPKKDFSDIKLQSDLISYLREKDDRIELLIKQNAELKAKYDYLANRLS